LKLFAFDFDKTVTTSDTILPLCRFLSKRFNSSSSFFYIQLLFAGYRLKFISSKKFKEMIIKYLLENKSLAEVESAILEFYKSNYKELFNHLIVELILEQKKAGDRIIVVTSNLDLFVRPVKKLLPIDEVFGTKVRVSDASVSGSIEGENCSGLVKAKVVKEFSEKFKFDKIVAYGDSSGDFDILKLADESYIAEYKFDSLRSKLHCRLKYLCGRICSDGFKVVFKKF
jgi:HAD superfamily hydrolase (TIGR01490 family)